MDQKYKISFEGPELLSALGFFHFSSLNFIYKHIKSGLYAGGKTGEVNWRYMFFQSYNISVLLFLVMG
jgi:hypothetical protein